MNTSFSRSVWTFGALCVLMAGCFKSVDVADIYCATDDNCPSGYFCADSTKPGGCQLKATDSADASPLWDSDVERPDTEGGNAGDASDALVDSSPDSAADLGPGTDVIPPADASDAFPPRDMALDNAPLDAPLLDAAPDMPVSPDTRRKAPGETCSGGQECESTFCADGVCCESACGGQCQACAEANKLGTCLTISGAPRGTRAACDGTGICAGQCGGTAPDRCVYPGSATSCGEATCSDELTVRPASMCNGAGACGTAQPSPCGAGKYCSAGACVTQLANGTHCQSVSQCASGNCSVGTCCALGQTACDSTCVDLLTNNANCGACGKDCAAGSTCRQGACLTSDGRPCAKDSACASGICSTFLQDPDGDGYANSFASFKMCGATPPAGYTTRAGDCCEGNPNVHPGVTGYYTSPADCNGAPTWDYDCSGTAEKREEEHVDSVCTNVEGSGCTLVPASGTPAEGCGETYSIPFITSCAAKMGFCMFLAGTMTGGTVACH